MRNFLSKSVRRASFGLGAFVASTGVALATEPAIIDTTDLVATIDSGSAPINSVGLAVLSILALLVVFGLVRRAMRG